MSQSQFYQVLHREPLVVFAKVPWADYFAPRFEVDQPLSIICGTNWKLEREDKIKAIDWAKYHEQRYPNHHIEFVLDRPEEIELFRDKFGLNVTHVNVNALSDERVYRVLPRNKIYAGVYVARPARHKHLKLCEQIKGQWLWLTYDTDATPKITRETLAMPNVYAPQFSDNEYTGYIPRASVSGWLCQAGCGLALSNLEGSMYASVEYLLCGLPVVETETDGVTRAQLFDPRTAITVKPNMYSVAQAVAEAPEFGRQTGAETIREITLGKMRPHRERFVDAVRCAYKAVGIDHDPAYDLFHMQTPYMSFWQPVENVLMGGSADNQALLAVADEEPKTRKLWTPLAGRFWENALPEPAGVGRHER